MVPLVSCVWSTSQAAALGYPARYLFAFLDNHGMLSVTGSPQWRTVVGGSRSYVEKAAKDLTSVRLATPVRSIHRDRGRRHRPRRRRRRRALRQRRRRHPRRHGAAPARRADRRRARRCSARSATPATTPCCTPTTSCCRERRRPRRPGTTCMPSCATSSADVIVSYDINRLQRLNPDAVPRQPQCHRPRSIRSVIVARWTTSTRSTTSSRSPRSAGCPS